MRVLAGRARGSRYHTPGVRRGVIVKSLIPIADSEGTTYTESFDTGDGTIIEPDLTWEKLDTTDGSEDVGADDGEMGPI